MKTPMPHASEEPARRATLGDTTPDAKPNHGAGVPSLSIRPPLTAAPEGLARWPSDKKATRQDVAPIAAQCGSSAACFTEEHD